MISQKELTPEQLKKIAKMLKEYFKKNGLAIPEEGSKILISLDKGEISEVTFVKGSPHRLH